MEFKITGVSDLPDWIHNNQISFKLNGDFFIQGDSTDYDVLWNSAKKIKDVDGLVLELGVRLGKGIFTIMNACIENDDKDRRFFGIDCYGAWAESFTNEMKIAAKMNMFAFCGATGLDFTLFELEDTEFMERYADGIPIYNRTIWDTHFKHTTPDKAQYKPDDYEWKKVVNEYALVHIDGPHRMQYVVPEVEFFLPRIVKGGIAVFDDINKKDEMYDHDEVEKMIFDHGFELVEKKGSKASYIKV